MGEVKMRRCVIGVYNGTDWVEATPAIYSSSWGYARPYIYNGSSWQPVGHANTLMVPFITSDNKDFYSYNNEQFLVRQHE